MFKAQLQEIFWTIVREQWEDMEWSFESMSRHDQRFWPYLFATVSETAGQHSGGRELSGPLLSILVPAVRQETRQEILIELAAWSPPPPSHQWTARMTELIAAWETHIHTPDANNRFPRISGWQALITLDRAGWLDFLGRPPLLPRLLHEARRCVPENYPDSRLLEILSTWTPSTKTEMTFIREWDTFWKNFPRHYATTISHILSVQSRLRLAAGGLLPGGPAEEAGLWQELVSLAQQSAHWNVEVFMGFQPAQVTPVNREALRTLAQTWLEKTSEYDRYIRATAWKLLEQMETGGILHELGYDVLPHLVTATTKEKSTLVLDAFAGWRPRVITRENLPWLEHLVSFWETRLKETHARRDIDLTATIWNALRNLRRTGAPPAVQAWHRLLADFGRSPENHCLSRPVGPVFPLPTDPPDLCAGWQQAMFQKAFSHIPDTAPLSRLSLWMYQWTQLVEVPWESHLGLHRHLRQTLRRQRQSGVMEQGLEIPDPAVFRTGHGWLLLESYNLLPKLFRRVASIPSPQAGTSMSAQSFCGQVLRAAFTSRDPFSVTRRMSLLPDLPSPPRQLPLTLSPSTPLLPESP